MLHIVHAHCFGGVDGIEANGRISRDGDTIVVHWCAADRSLGRVLDRGDMRAPLAPDARLRFHTRVASCSVPYEPP